MLASHTVGVELELTLFGAHLSQNIRAETRLANGPIAGLEARPFGAGRVVPAV